ncbi:hypothetical protein [Desulfopila sp. IMCC35008]|uniref:hypothetical protein n=1 Tax=Desulfopila sp. IMCC35008 TaxID=2653858 RepID=UPI0013D3D014|nr:hypothetical protein [Desulfopila sp. IMCC35008]
MQEEREVAVVGANTAPLGTLHIYWLFSRNQIEFILTEIETLTTSGENVPDRARYIDEALPLIDLETHFGLEGQWQTPADKYIVTKTTDPKGELVKIIIPAAHPLRMKKLSFATTPAPGSALKKNEEHILGAFFQDNETLLVVPDLQTIVKFMKM